MDVIQPLNELGEREVLRPEIMKIVDDLKAILSKLKNSEMQFTPLKKELAKLAKDTEDLLEGEKERKIQAADARYGDLEKALEDLDDLKFAAAAKLKQYQGMIDDAKANEGQQDPQLMGRLKQLEKEAAAIEKDLRDIDDREKEIKKKCDDAKKMIDDAYSNPEGIVVQQIDGILDGINDLKDKVDTLNDRVEAIDADLDKKIEELILLLARSNGRKEVDNLIKELSDQLRLDLGNLKDLLKKLPEQLEAMLKTLGEMKLGSTPDESADYWEERKDIDLWIKCLTDAMKDVKKLEDNFKAKDAKVKDLFTQAKRENDIEPL